MWPPGWDAKVVLEQRESYWYHQKERMNFIRSVDLTFRRVLRGCSWAVMGLMAGMGCLVFTNGKKLSRTWK